MWWVGAKYNFLPQLSGTVAYYHVDQNDYLKSGNKTCAQQSGATPGSNCAGSESATSLLLDYQVNKRVDVYGGAMYSQASGGHSKGFLNGVTDNTTLTIGSRLKF